MTERQCYGRTRTLRRCARRGSWRFLCEEHKRQPIVFFCFLVFTVFAGLASIYSACWETDDASRLAIYETWAAKVDEYSALDDRVRRWESENAFLRCGEPAESVADLDNALEVAQVPVSLREVYRQRQRKYQTLVDYGAEIEELGYRLETDEFLIPRPALLPAGILPEFTDHPLHEIDCYFGALHGACTRIFTRDGLLLPRGMFSGQMPKDLMLYFSASETPRGILLDLLSANQQGQAIVKVDGNRWAVARSGLRWASDEQRLARIIHEA